jgi:hypothetical protein
VALEYGFMKAMNKRVGLFRNADFSGKLAKTFEIDSAHALNVGSLKTAIQAWLLDVAVSPREHA